MSEWQPISTAPRDGTLILLNCKFTSGPREPIIARWSDTPMRGAPQYGDFHWVIPHNGGGVALKIPTHWAPLPKFKKRNRAAPRTRQRSRV